MNEVIKKILTERKVLLNDKLKDREECIKMVTTSLETTKRIRDLFQQEVAEINKFLENNI